MQISSWGPFALFGVAVLLFAPFFYQHTVAWVLRSVHRRFLETLRRDLDRESLTLWASGQALATLDGGVRRLAVDLRDLFFEAVQRQQPAAFMRYVDAATEVARSPLPHFEEIEESLLPLLVTRDEADAVGGEGGCPLLRHKLAPGLVVVYRYRVGELHCLVTLPEATQWGREQPELHATALKNLEQCTQGARLSFVNPIPSRPWLVKVQGDDGLVATRVLLAQGLLPSGGRGWALSLPDRDSLFLCPSDLPFVRLRMSARARRHFQLSPFAVTRELLSVDAGGELRPLATRKPAESLSS